MKGRLLASLLVIGLMAHPALAGGKKGCAPTCGPVPRTLSGYELRCMPQVVFNETACCSGRIPKYEYCLPGCNPCRDDSRFWDNCPDCWHNILPNR